MFISLVTVLASLWNSLVSRWDLAHTPISLLSTVALTASMASIKLKSLGLAASRTLQNCTRKLKTSDTIQSKEHFHE